MSQTLIGPVLGWLMLGCSVLYLIEPLWRLRRNRPGKWGPLHIELFLPVVFILSVAGAAIPTGARLFAAGFFVAGAVVRLGARRRLGISPVPKPPQ